MSELGFVHLVGAGPGDPELITLRGARRLARADVVVHDRLIALELLELAPERARRIDVGKRPGRHPWPQHRINRLLVAEARRGRRVVRLKGGDSFVFGRGGEECDELARHDVPFEVVPGVTSAVAAPALAGIPLTDRRHAASFTVVTGHRSSDGTGSVDWSAVSRSDTIVVLMGLAEIERVVARLVENGRAADTPAAVVSRAGTPEQRVVAGSLRTIARRSIGLPGPATIVVGHVVLSARETPLAGRTVRQDVVA